MIKIHNEGKKTVLFTTLMVISFSISAWILLPTIFSFFAQIILLLIFVIVLRFFRNPERIFTKDENSIIAPADGEIVTIEEVVEKEYFKDKRIQISIFMSIYNVHVNRYPISGRVSFYKYHKGKYLVARHPKSSDLNERTSIAVKNNHTEILFRQIAGYVARRIICNAKQDKKVKQNDEMGFIKFGSRVDIFLPRNSEILVKKGDKSISGITRIAALK